MPQKLSGKEHGLSGSTLKYIAIITMLIDHFGAAFFIVFTSFYAGTACFAQADILYQVMRGIGRTAFPIFCFVRLHWFRRSHLIWHCLTEFWSLEHRMFFLHCFWDCCRQHSSNVLWRSRAGICH